MSDNGGEFANEYVEMCEQFNIRILSYRTQLQRVHLAMQW